MLNFLFRWAAYRVMIGRVLDPGQPSAGRFVKKDIVPILASTIRNAEILGQEANLSQFRSRGNRLTTLAGIYSLSAYRALRKAGISREYATELFGDIGWKLYALGVKIPLFFIRPFSSNPQTRLNFVLRVLLFFPFNQDPAGYQRTYWKEPDRYCTDWHRCVVFDYFRAHASEEEIDFFRATWCRYDFALPRLVHPEGFYERPHTLSHGDKVCDMRWYGRKSG